MVNALMLLNNNAFVYLVSVLGVLIGQSDNELEVTMMIVRSC